LEGRGRRGRASSRNEAVAPSGQVKMAGHVKSRLQQLNRDLRLASRLYTSTNGSTT
jgi:hypothetical protein